MAITKTDIFDFLIDIVPRDDLAPPSKINHEAMLNRNSLVATEALPQYAFQFAQQQQQAVQDNQQLGSALNSADLLLYQQQQQIQNLRYLQHTQIMQQLQLQQGQLQHDNNARDSVERSDY